MKALTFLLITTIKNRLLSLKKKPSLLILYIIIAAYFMFLFVMLSKTNIEVESQQTFSDIRILYMIIAGLAIIFTYSSIVGGLSRGSTLFNMADVGLLFVTPISSVKILFYGLVKQMGTTLLASFFIIFQLGNIKANFDVSNKEIIFLFVFYTILVFYTHILSMAIYIFTNYSQKRKNVIKASLILAGLLMLLIVFYYFNNNGGNILNALFQTMDNKVFQFIPVVGWSIMSFSSVIKGNLMWLLISLLLFALSSSGMIFMFIKDQGDYYEDVLVSTEYNYEVMQKAKEGKTNVNVKARIRDNDLGFQGGNGPSVLFFKDLIARRRTSKIPFVNGYTIIATASAGIFVYFMKESFSVYIVLGFLIYMQLFTVTIGYLAQELKKPFIYMIPGKSLYKLIYASLGNIIKAAIDGVIIFTVVSISSGTSLIRCLFLALAYVSAVSLFSGYTILMQRIFGAQPNKIVQGIVGIILFMIIFSPGIVLSVLTINFLPAYMEFLGTLPFSLSCLSVTVLIYLASGNLIDKAELTS